MKAILNALVGQEKLTREETKQILLNIVQESYNEAQLAALMMAWQMRSITIDELLGLRDGILETGVFIDTAPYEVLDIVGTGGDGKNTFNISTCACFVVAGAGYKVVKHGNYAASSVSGASNVIEAQGVQFATSRQQVLRSLEYCNISYLHAPLFAKAMKFVAPTRRALQIPTVFNLLGPLVNPAHPKYQVLGVANLEQMRLYQHIYQKLGVQYAIVNSLDGYDEISLTGEFKMCSNTLEKIFAPADLGFKKVIPADLFGGTSKESAAAIFERVLKNESSPEQKNVVLANACIAIHVLNPELSIADCLAQATESLESGKAYETLKKFREVNA
ncbi:MAG: anthranilate phosphoribosyltransferase [Paludibacteraceae bacterium]|nr:anthranilate phosphoribosyltransferase [Paludibacteraceae bacterium]